MDIPAAPNVLQPQAHAQPQFQSLPLPPSETQSQPQPQPQSQPQPQQPQLQSQPQSSPRPHSLVVEIPLASHNIPGPLTTPARTPKKWTTAMEIALFNAVAKCKPVGIHKHFRMTAVFRHFSRESPIRCSIDELWEQLENFYDLDTLDEIEEGLSESDSDSSRSISGEHYDEFILPPEEYEEMISEHRLNDQSSIQGSPTPSAKRSRGRKDGSPTPSVETSVASTPEPDDGGSGKRRGRPGRGRASSPDGGSAKNTPTPGGRKGRGTTSTPTPTSSTARGRKPKKK